MSASGPEMNVRKLAGDLRFDRGSITRATWRLKPIGPVSSRRLLTRARTERAARRRASRGSPVAAGSGPLLPAAGRHQARAGGRRSGERHARRAEDGGQRRVLGRQLRAGRSSAISAWTQESRGHARRQQRRHGADSEPRRVEDARDGQADFKWVFSPARINFKFAGPHVEGFGYSAANVRAKGIYEPRSVEVRCERRRLRRQRNHARDVSFRHARAAAFVFARRHVQNLDMRRLPPRLSMPELETQAAGRISSRRAAETGAERRS